MASGKTTSDLRSEEGHVRWCGWPSLQCTGQATARQQHNGSTLDQSMNVPPSNNQQDMQEDKHSRQRVKEVEEQILDELALPPTPIQSSSPQATEATQILTSSLKNLL